MIWEYKVVGKPVLKTVMGLGGLNELDKAGMEGWELVTAVPTGADMKGELPRYEWIFKRPKV